MSAPPDDQGRDWRRAGTFSGTLLNQAAAAAAAGRLQEAYKLLVSASRADPAAALPWYRLGSANADLGLWESAVLC
ncbi:MAG: hypothetical protein ACREFP_24635, partial [Acetobacteraceae bacterium]